MGKRQPNLFDVIERSYMRFTEDVWAVAWEYMDHANRGQTEWQSVRRVCNGEMDARSHAYWLRKPGKAKDVKIRNVELLHCTLKWEVVDDDGRVEAEGSAPRADERGSDSGSGVESADAATASDAEGTDRTDVLPRRAKRAAR